LIKQNCTRNDAQSTQSRQQSAASAEGNIFTILHNNSPPHLDRVCMYKFKFANRRKTTLLFLPPIIIFFVFFWGEGGREGGEKNGDTNLFPCLQTHYPATHQNYKATRPCKAGLPPDLGVKQAKGLICLQAWL
jgi:hypothetical protein